MYGMAWNGMALMMKWFVKNVNRYVEFKTSLSIIDISSFIVCFCIVNWPHQRNKPKKMCEELCWLFALEITINRCSVIRLHFTSNFLCFFSFLQIYVYIYRTQIAYSSWLWLSVATPQSLTQMLKSSALY